MQNQVGTDFVRAAKLDGNRLTLKTPPIQVGGEKAAAELVCACLNQFYAPGSFCRVAFTPLKMPMPSTTSAPAMIHGWGTCARTAA